MSLLGLNPINVIPGFLRVLILFISSFDIMILYPPKG